jgi:hypothetical protein
MSDSDTADTTAPPEPLDDPGGDQSALGSGRATGQGRDREQRDPAEEHPPVTEQVSEPAAEEQEAAKRQQVTIDDPRQRGLREAEVPLDRGQRHVDDRAVENDHERAQAQHDQGKPARAAI